MIGRTLLHYEVVEKVGAGGMGEVYLARDKKLRRNVALKVLPSKERGQVTLVQEIDVGKVRKGRN